MMELSLCDSYKKAVSQLKMNKKLTFVINILTPETRQSRNGTFLKAFFVALSEHTALKTLQNFEDCMRTCHYRNFGAEIFGRVFRYYSLFALTLVWYYFFFCILFLKFHFIIFIEGL